MSVSPGNPVLRTGFCLIDNFHVEYIGIKKSFGFMQHEDIHCVVANASDFVSCKIEVKSGYGDVDSKV